MVLVSGGAGVAHLLVPLDLGVHEGPQDVRGERQVDMDELCLLVQAVQGEVVSELHGLDHVLLLQAESQSKHWTLGCEDVGWSICSEPGADPCPHIHRREHQRNAKPGTQLPSPRASSHLHQTSALLCILTIPELTQQTRKS